MARDRVRERTYKGVTAHLVVAETRAGAGHVEIATSGGGDFVRLDAERCEQLGIDLQIRASYLRGVRPPTGPEPDVVEPGPDDVPLITVDEPRTP